MFRNWRRDPVAYTHGYDTSRVAGGEWVVGEGGTPEQSRRAVSCRFAFAGHPRDRELTIKGVAPFNISHMQRTWCRGDALPTNSCSIGMM